MSNIAHKRVAIVLPLFPISISISKENLAVASSPRSQALGGEFLSMYLNAPTQGRSPIGSLPAGLAMPLCRTHAEYIKLVHSYPLEAPN